MDRALDEIIAERPRGVGGRRPRRGGGNFPRDGVKKSSQKEEPRNLDREWLHDKYVDDDMALGRRRGRADRYSTTQEPVSHEGAKLKLENLHYDVTEEELKELFNRIGSVQSVRLLYDRQDRSEGIAYVTYFDTRDARTAIREYDGANAHGQPIRLTMMPSAPSASRARNSFDTTEPPRRSLFDRISGPDVRRRRARSASPIRHSDVTRPAPEGIDRYVPGQRGRRSPVRRRGTPREGGRRPGARREPRPKKDDEGHAMVQGRPRKTQEELDAEMADYWGGGNGEQTILQSQDRAAPIIEDDDATNGAAEVMGTTTAADDDIDMIE